MATIEPNPTESVTEAYETTREGTRGVLVETEGGAYEYWFPYRLTADMDDINISDSHVLDSAQVTVTGPGAEGTTNATVPQKVADRAEAVSGYLVV